MKKLLIALAAVAVTVATHAQGTVVFNNRNTAIGLDAPITLETAGGAGPGPSYNAGLYFNGALVPDSVVSFRDGSANATLAKYINGKTVVIPGAAIEAQNVTVEMRAWLASAGSYEAAPALQRNTSGPLVIAQLGGGVNPNVDNFLPETFTGFVIPVVPEPSTIALGVLGAAALLLRRRK
jgi:hypothetical protein